MRATSLHAREQAIGEVQLAAAEVVSFDDMGQLLLPAIARMLDSSGHLVYRSELERPLVSMAGNEIREMTPEYVDRFYPEDPLQAAAHRENPWIMRFSRTPEWQSYVRRPVHDFMACEGFEFLLHVRLVEGHHCQPGMMGLLFARPGTQDDFSDDDALAMARLLPPLQAAARRCRRTCDALRTRRALEATLEDEARLALDLRGRLVWMSPPAARWLGDDVGTSHGLPAALVEAAAQLAALAAGTTPSTPPRATVRLQSTSGTPLRAQLRIARHGSGEPFLLIELDPATNDAPPPLPSSVPERFGLTRAETEVLNLLAAGLRDREIAERTFTSQHTVRTHVGRILSKLGVRSRLEAALLARGPGASAGTEAPRSGRGWAATRRPMDG